MPNMRTYSRAFNGGEVSPEFFGRIDDSKYQMGLALCLNFIVLPHGPAINRAGTEFVRSVKTPAKRTRLIPFTYSTDQTMVVELGEGYVRFHTQGATLISGATPYEIVSPFLESELFDIRYVQSADVMTLVHPAHPPLELRRLGALSWTLVAIDFGTTSPAPTGLSAVATVPTPTPTYTRAYDYVVTSVIGADESLASVVSSCTNNLDSAGARNTLSWSAVTGPAGVTVYYNAYRLEAGIYAFVGQTTLLTMVDEGISPDVSRAPPSGQNPFIGAGNYPSAVTYFEQRRVFASTLNAPQTLWMTRSGTESNLNTSIPLRSDDAISFRIAAREANTIRHLVPLQELLLMTQATEWRVGSGSSDALRPDTLSVKPQSFVGSGNAAPLVVNNNLVFSAARGGHIRELGFSNDAGGYITSDLSLRASHLFDGLTIVDTAQTKSPYPICWHVSSSGVLLGLTYIPEQQIAAWHQHTTAGVFESVACVAEGEEDVTYFVVRRTIGGATVRYVERTASRRFTDPADAFFVDAGVRYNGAPETVFSSGLGHLEGELVNVLADGAVVNQQRITGGALTLEQPASKVVVGLPITADLRTLPLALEIQGYGQGRPKNVNEVWFRVNESGNLFAGPNVDKLQELKVRKDENLGSPPALQTGEVSLKLSSSWSQDGALCVRQTEPLPLSILSISMEVAIGG